MSRFARITEDPEYADDYSEADEFAAWDDFDDYDDWATWSVPEDDFEPADRSA